MTKLEPIIRVIREIYYRLAVLVTAQFFFNWRYITIHFSIKIHDNSKFYEHITILLYIISFLF